MKMENEKTVGTDRNKKYSVYYTVVDICCHKLHIAMLISKIKRGILSPIFLLWVFLGWRMSVWCSTSAPNDSDLSYTFIPDWKSYVCEMKLNCTVSCEFAALDVLPFNCF